MFCRFVILLLLNCITELIQVTAINTFLEGSTMVSHVLEDVAMSSGWELLCSANMAEFYGVS
jgi:hypothetical protein